MTESRREGRRAEDQERKRRDALAGATAVFAAKGYHDAQMTEIAAAAELSRATLYALFEGKDHIFQEVIRDAATRVRDDVRARVERVPDARERLLALIDALLDCFDENRDVLRLVLLGTNGLPWRIRLNLGASSSMVADFNLWVVDLCQDATKNGDLAGLDSEAVAMSLVGSVLTLAAQVMESDEDGSLSEQAPRIRAIFERLLVQGPK